MNFSQRLGLFILILISVAYVYFSFFDKEIKLPEFNLKNDESAVYNPLENKSAEKVEDKKQENKNIKIFLLDKNGNLRSVNRVCDVEREKSCFAFAIKELVNAPTKWEKSKGFTSEIPQGTKIISIRESTESIMIDLSSNFN